MISSERRSFLLGAGFAAVCAGSAAAESSLSTGAIDVRSLVAAERKRILEAMKSHDIPGVALCCIYEGQPILIEGLGVTDRLSNRSVDTETIFSIQSTSKNVTAVGIMIAVQHGLLDLDAPIIAYLPEFFVQSCFEPAPQQKITLRILLSHRAGFTHEAPVGNNYDPAFPNFEAHVRSISQTWLRFPVGERYRYSNLGYDLAGYILQKRSGMPFETWIKTMVFDPIGMKDSTMAADVYAARTNRATGHMAGYDKVPLKTPLISSGGVYTSARDIASYSMFHLNRGRANGRTVLKEELWDAMHAFPFGGDYSLGVIRSELRYGATPIRLLSHQGGGFGFGSVFYYRPETGFAYVTLFNRPASVAYQFGRKLIDDAFSSRYGGKKARLPVEDLGAVKIPAPWQEKYLGNYVARNFSADLIVKNETFGLQTGKTFAPVHFTSPSELFTADEDGSAFTYEYSAATSKEPAHLECFIGEDSLDYNEGPHDPPGPDSPSWAPYLGTYQIEMWERSADKATIHRKNGYLYLNNIRLITEFEPGLFFTSDGEAVDFRSRVPTWKNIRLKRI
jgi:CubicO group peptidase (beta-lactamase class C family)